MKKYFTKMMALACMFMLVGANAWGKQTWSGSSLSTSVLTPNQWYKFTNSLSVKSNKIKADGTYHGYRFDQDSNGNAMATLKLADNVTTSCTVILTVQSAGDPQYRVITVEGTGYSHTYENVSYYSTTKNVGTTITIDMQAGEECTIKNDFGKWFVIKQVEVQFDGVDNFVIDETQSKATNDALINAKAGHGATVKLKRTLKAGQWNSFCLPFSLPHANFIAAFGENAKMYEMTGYDGENITFEASVSTTGSNTMFIYNRPYLVKPDHDIVNPVFKLTDSSVQTVNESTLTHTLNGLSFIGTYGYVNIYTEDHSMFFLTNDGGFAYPTRNDEGENLYGTIKGLRCYFKLENSSTDVKGLNCIFEDNATGIIRVEKDPFQENGNVYTIDGRNMGNAKNLTPGMYIQNGRKFIVK